MHLFDADDTLRKYEKVKGIIDTYYVVRLKLYQDRKDYMIDALVKELVTLTNKARYIKENLDGTIDLRKKKKEEVNQMLTEKGYDILDNDTDFKYLVKMPMDSVTEENVEKLLKSKGNKELELETIKSTTIYQMWKNELDELKEKYAAYCFEREMIMNGEEHKKKKSVVKKGGAIKKNLVIIE